MQNPNNKRPSRAQGIHGSGGNVFTAKQRTAVVRALRAATDPLSVADLSAISGVPGRTVRAIVSAADGVDFLLGGGTNGGYALAKTHREAELFNRRVSSQIVTMGQRLARRRRLARAKFGG